MSLSNGNETAILVTVDLLGLSSSLCREIREQIEDQFGIPAASVMVSCSHTHSGPMVPPWRPDGMGRPDEAYMAKLRERIVTCVGQSIRTPVEVRVGYGSGTCDLAVNRRLPWDQGNISFPPHADPAGPVDRNVDVLRFENASGTTVAVLVSYGCHPTVGGTSEWVGPDYPGAMREAIEMEFPSALAAFILGNCGDVRSYYTNPDGSFRWDTTPDLVDDAGRRVGSVAAEVARTVRTDSRGVLRTGRAVRKVYTQDDVPIEESEFLAFLIGGVAVVSNPAECFASIGLEVRRSASVPVLFSSITNGFFGYVPTIDAYQYGGYEVEMSWRSFGLTAPVRQDTHAAFRDGMSMALQQCSLDRSEP